MKKKFFTIFYHYKDYNFLGDIPQIPIYFKRVFNYDSSIFCLNNGSYDRTQEKITVRFVKHNLKLTQILFNIITSYNKMSIINLTHFIWYNFLFAIVAKTIHPKGKVFLRLDFHQDGVSATDRMAGVLQDDKWFYKSKDIRKKIKNYIILKGINSIDLFTIQDEKVQNYLLSKYRFFHSKLSLSYNGVSVDYIKESRIKLKKYKEKDNIICFAGRIGSYAKATDLLINAYRKMNHINWELHLAGPIDKDFLGGNQDKFIEYITEFNREENKKIVYHGLLTSDALYNLYNKSKVFCLTSIFEGMPLVVPEAMYFRNTIIMTDVGGATVATQNGKSGLIIKNRDPGDLARVFENVIGTEDWLKSTGEFAHKTACEILDWNIIVKKLHEDLYKS